MKKLEIQVNSIAYFGMGMYPIRTLPQNRMPKAILIYAFISLSIFPPNFTFLFGFLLICSAVVHYGIIIIYLLFKNSYSRAASVSSG